jgi:Tol biopolymer transport system component
MALANPGNAVQIKSQASSNDGNEGLTWTPDGRLVYVRDASGNPDIWIMRSDGSRRVQLTSNAGRDVSPRVTSARWQRRGPADAGCGGALARDAVNGGRSRRGDVRQQSRPPVLRQNPAAAA